MTTWDRTQRLELELAQLEAKLRATESRMYAEIDMHSARSRDLEDQLRRSQDELKAQRTASVTLIMAVEDQRDSARSIAVRLEQELAERERELDELIGLLEDDGDSQLALELKLVELRRRGE